MSRKITTVKVDAIYSAGNVREAIGDVRELAKSIEAVGLLSPLLVAGTKEAPTVIAGHRRLAAVEALGWEEVEVIFLEPGDGPSERSRVATQLVENMQREDLTPLEEAAGLKELTEELGNQAAAAKAVGRSRAHVSKRLKLLELDEEAQAAISGGTITAEDAYELAKVESGKDRREALAMFEHGAPERARASMKQAQTRQARPELERKAAKAVAGQKHRKGTKVIALTDLRAEHKEAKSIEGWQGISVDWDEHQAEPCNVLVVGFHNTFIDTEPTEVFYCLEPGRHEPDGDSELKLMHTIEDDEREARDAERAKLQAEAEERAGAAAAWSASLGDRNVALKLLAMQTIRGSMVPAMVDAMRAVGYLIEDEALEELPDYAHQEQYLAEVLLAGKSADMWRVAVLITTTGLVNAYRLDPLAEAILELGNLEGRP